VGRAAVQTAAVHLGLSIPHIYCLIRVFRRHPVTASLLPHQPGQARGARKLASVIEARIESAIEAIYLKPERPTMKRLFREVRHDCQAAELKPPSMKALLARVTARGLRERVKAREGDEAAGNRFRQVKIGLRNRAAPASGPDRSHQGRSYAGR
jgi:putative transposase